jgi:hypothetical protein
MTDVPEPEPREGPVRTGLPWCPECEHFAPPVEGACPDCGETIEYVAEDL